jgi:hypothetical protein
MGSSCSSMCRLGGDCRPGLPPLGLSRFSLSAGDGSLAFALGGSSRPSTTVSDNRPEAKRVTLFRRLSFTLSTTAG